MRRVLRARKPGVKEISSPTFCFSRCILVFIMHVMMMMMMMGFI